MVDTSDRDDHAGRAADAGGPCPAPCPMCGEGTGEERHLERGLILFCCDACFGRVTPNFAAYNTTVLPQALSS